MIVIGIVQGSSENCSAVQCSSVNCSTVQCSVVVLCTALTCTATNMAALSTNLQINTSLMCSPIHHHYDLTLHNKNVYFFFY